MKQHVLSIAVFLSLVGAACGVEATYPPVELSYRDSLVGAGKVVQIKSTSSEPLTEIEVTFRAPSGEEREFKHPRLEAYEAIEVGWKKLGGWEIPDGADVEVRCEGFLRAYSSKIE